MFVSKRTFLDQKWGTREPVVFRDRELGVVRLRAFGTYAYRIRDSRTFVNTVVGSLGQFDTARLADFYRDMIVARLNDLLGESLTSILDLPAHYDELAQLAKASARRGLRQVRRRPLRLLRQLGHAAGRGAGAPRRARRRWAPSATSPRTRASRPRWRWATRRAPTVRAAAAPSGGLGIGLGAGFGVQMAGALSEAMRAGAGGGGGAAAAAGACARCGNPMPAGARFCPTCGAPLTARVPALPEAGARRARFCPACGAPMTPGPTAP